MAEAVSVDAPSVVASPGVDLAAHEEEVLSFLSGRDRTPQRATIYWVLVAVLAPGSLLLQNSPITGDPQRYTLMVTIGTVLALVIGFLSLVRFYSRKDSTFLFIGTGFLGTGFLDAYHGIVTSPLYPPSATPSELPDLMAWSWMASRVFLSLFLFVSYLAWRDEEKAGEGGRFSETSVYATAGGLTIILFAFFQFMPLPPAYFTDLFTPRPAELVPAFFFLLALQGYLWKGAWRSDAFEHWLIIALIMNALVSGAYMPLATQPYDATADAAVLLKIVSYVAVLVGIMVSMYVTFRREELAFAETRIAAEALRSEVSGRREAQRELAVSQANVSALIESTGDAIWSVGIDHRLITFNTAYALATEAATEREPTVGDAPAEVVQEGDDAWFEEHYEDALRGRRFSDIRVEAAGGQTRTFELFFNPIQAEDGTAGVVVFRKDITRQKMAEAALRVAKDEAEQANVAKSQFLANMSHELRTPLNSVIGFANILLKKEDQLGAKEKNFLGRILANGKHLLGLINEVLDLSKIEAGRMDLEIETFDLKDMVIETVHQIEVQVKDKPVVLVAEAPDGLQPVDSDRGKLKQIIINLMGNALKFTHEGSVTVRVSEGAQGRPNRIDIVDTGIGIADDRLEAIFEAFQQADTSTSRKYGGTGLGLTITRSLCRLLGYELNVSSEVGSGSIFSIDIQPPATEDDGQPLEDPRKAPRVAATKGVTDTTVLHTLDLKGKTVLVVDDDSDSRLLMVHFLEEFGCQIITATNGPEGLAMARSSRPDLITLDLMMPDMSGWEVLQHIKDDADLHEIPVVVVSMIAGENKGRVLGAVDLLNKPVDRETLLRVLARYVADSPGRVLVVDDDEDHRMVLRTHLEESGFEVREAENGQVALEALETFPADLVFLDLMMPVMDGMSFLEVVRENERHKALEVVVLTSKDLSPEEKAELERLSSAVIAKGDDLDVKLRGALNLAFREADASPLADS